MAAANAFASYGDDPHPPISAQVETITPSVAQGMLKHNPINRVLTKRVEVYVEAMRRGEWRTTGEAIQFDRTGRLLNGQHRLTAVVLSGVTIQVLVVRNLAPEAQDVMDTGRARTLGDVFSIHGEQHPKVLAAALRQVYSYELCGIPVDHVVQPALRLTTQRGLEALERHPGLREVVGNRYAPGFPASVISAFHYIFRYVDRDDADAFIDLLVGGGAPRGSSVFALRERMIKHVTIRQHLSPMQRAALTFGAFNHWREGTKVSKLQLWKGGGARPEKFPSLNDTTFPFDESEAP